MKNQFSLTTLVLLTTVLLPSTGCPRRDSPIIAQVTPAPSVATTPAPVVTTQDPFGEMFAALEAATLGKHEDLSAIQQRMDQTIDAQVSAWKAAGHNVSLAADEKLDSATEDFAEKLRLLTLSGDDVWVTAKHNTKLSLLSVQSAYIAIMNNPSGK